MSLKRQATSDLNHENWDREEPEEESVKVGMFNTASKEDMQKRVIRTAKRRFTQASGDEAKKGVFSGFGGFNKTQPSSFDFLANLTNGNKAPATLPTTTASLSMLNKPLSFQSTTVSSSTTTTSTTFGVNSQPSSQPGGSSASPPQPSSLFSTSKVDSTVKDSPFKLQTTQASEPSFGLKTSTCTTAPQVSSSLFGTPASTSMFNTTSTSNIFKIQPVSSTTPVQSTFKLGGPSVTKSNEIKPATENKTTIVKETKSDNPSKMKYYANLKALNEGVLDWIKKHVEESPICILTPIFDDYKKYLKDIQDTYDKSTSNQQPVSIEPSESKSHSSPAKSDATATNTLIAPKIPASSSLSLSPSAPTSTASPEISFGAKKDTTTASPFALSTNNSTASPFAVSTNKSPTSQFALGTNNTKTSPFASTNNSTTAPFASSNSSTTSPFASTNKSTTSPFASTNNSTTLPFSSTNNTTTSPFASTNNPTSSPFASTNNPTTSPFASTNNPTTSPFASTNNTTTSPFSLKAGNNSGSAPFSFGIGKPFSFSPSTTKPEDTGNENKTENVEEQDEPPKVEFTPVIEENSVFDKRCKIFVKKDENFVDKGVGTLYIKKLDSGKHQLLARANTNLGTVLLNLILANSVPTKRMGKNNVMLVCIPTPEAKPPPVPVLIRVKTSEEADELLETLEKHKS